MKRTLLFAPAALLAIAALGAACQKSDQAIVQQQFQDAANACPKGCDNPPPGCNIKGNIGSTGLKFFILPDNPLWPAAIIEPIKGEKWFCNEREALDNGFQPVPSRNERPSNLMLLLFPDRQKLDAGFPPVRGHRVVDLGPHSPALLAASRRYRAL